MAEESIKKNFLYKSILTISTYLINFVTFPYVSRILGVDKIGLVSFVENVVNYFLLFATLGISILGVREIAAIKNDNKKCSQVFSNILGLNLLFTFVTLVIYVICIMCIPKFHQYSELFYIGAAKILFTAFLVEWFYTGLEKFRYITIRSLLVKFLYILSIFFFVRTQNDYKLYFILTVLVVVINSIINISYVRRFVHIKISDLFVTRYIKQNLSLGLYNIMTSMYLTFNVMFLGLTSGNIEVGYYTTAFKLYSVILGFFTAFTNVMLPRMSVLLAEGEKNQFQQMIERSFEAMCSFSIPMIMFSITLAPHIIYVLSGDGYEGAILPMQIIMPAVLFVGIAQILAIQVLLPLKKDKPLFIASLFGALFSLLINITIVPIIQSIGTAIVLLCSEIIVTMVYVIYTLKSKIVVIPWSIIGKDIIYSLPCFLFCYICGKWISNSFISIGFAFVISLFYWIGIQIRFKTIIGHEIMRVLHLKF